MTNAIYSRTTSPEMARTLELFKVIREEANEREMPAQLVLTFLFVASHNGCSQEALAAELDMSASSVSRCVSWLGDKHRLEHRSGLNWVKRVRDPHNHRAWNLILTVEGQALLLKLCRLQLV